VSQIVGITARCIQAEGAANEERDCLSHDWWEFLSELGLTPVLIPNRLPSPVDFLKSAGITRLLLSSGNNLQPLPEETVNFGDFYPQRDRTETELLSHAEKEGIPVFGVCRGMQMINRYFGGGISRSLSESLGKSKPHVTDSHLTRIVTSDMKRLLGPTVDVNSYHDQGIKRDQVASPLEIFAICDDDIVEGIYHPKLPILAIMWHPERPHASIDETRKILYNWLK
jgi:N5-(cytidine 5'-diphosphoramidyl)-L-glutamine hydrolase